jgi:HPt (histidine-containing phosphotransfer) domain-containing protein
MSDAIETALAEIWQRMRPIVLARISTVELATAALPTASLSDERIEAGYREAHKLAGVLGTFGLERGTRLARDLEEHLASPGAAAEAVRLQRVASNLRATVEHARA